MASSLVEIPVNTIGDVQVISSTLSVITFSPNEVSRDSQVSVHIVSRDSQVSVHIVSRDSQVNVHIVLKQKQFYLT